MLVRRDVNATIVSSILTFDLNWLEVVSVFSQRSNNSKCSKWDDDFQWWVYFKGCLSTTNQSFPSGGFSRKHHALFWGRSLDEPLCSSLAASFAHSGDSQLENFHLQQPGFAEMMVFFYPMQVNPRFGILPLFVVFEWITEQDHTLVITLIKSKVGFGVCTRHIWAPRWKRSAWCLQHLMPGGKAIHAPKSYWFLSSLDCWPACSGATRCTPSMARPVFWRPSHILVPINPAWSTEKGNQIKEFRPKTW